MLKVKLFLETGQTVEFVTEGLEIEKNQMVGLSKLKWGKTTTGANLEYVDLNKVIAVVTEDVPSEEVKEDI